MQASQSILAQSERDEDKEGMGTTIACLWIIGNRMYVASVGNSRIYLLRNKQLIQVNKDHTWVQEAVDAGALTPAQAREHPHANVIRRYLGSPQPVEVDLRLRLSPKDNDRQALANQGALLQPNDRLLICSDGLNDMIEDHLIQHTLINYEIKPAVYHLIELANQKGGKDNITAVLLDNNRRSGKKAATNLLKHPVRIGILLGVDHAGRLFAMMVMGWFGYQVFG